MNFFDIMNKKRLGLILSDKEIEYVIKGYMKHDITAHDMANFMEIIALKNMTDREMIFLTKCMIQIEPKKESIDCHTVSVCSLGSPFDNCCLLASVMAKISGASVRNIMYKKGLEIDLDVMYQVEELQNGYAKELVSILKENLEQSFFLLEDSFFEVREKIGQYDNCFDIIHSIPYLTCSLISKVVLGGSCNLVVDIKVGGNSFFQNMKVAQKFSRVLIKVGKENGVKVICTLNDCTTLLEKSIGLVAIVADLANYLKDCQYNKSNRKVVLSLELASYMVGMSCGLSYKEAKKKVETNFFNQCLLKGNVDKRIQKIKAQVNKFEFKSPKEGYITSINVEVLAKLALELGILWQGEENFNSFIILNKMVYDKVNRGDVLITLYTNKVLKASVMNHPIFRISKVSSKKNRLIELTC